MTFQQLLRDARHEAAHHCRQQSALELNEIAHLFGLDAVDQQAG